VRKTNTRPVGHCQAIVCFLLSTSGSHRWHGRLACYGRAEGSRPKAAQRRAEGAGLDGEFIGVAAMRTMIGHCPQSRVPVFTHNGLVELLFPSQPPNSRPYRRIPILRAVTTV
jgi:hypothetical protein